MSNYKNPTPTVDILIVRGKEILLISRKNPPYGWALPGGFCDEGEWVEHAAIREAKEEVGLDVQLQELFYVYSDPKRDARLHSYSTVFIAYADGEPAAADDAVEARYFPLNALPSPIAFDHAEIIADYCHYRDSGKRIQLKRYLETQATSE